MADKKNAKYAEQKRGEQRPLFGEVTATNTAKTIIVSIERRMMHPKYKKYIRRHSKIHAHDEKGEAKLGDTVSILESRRFSKLKRYRLGQVIKRRGDA